MPRHRIASSLTNRNNPTIGPLSNHIFPHQFKPHKKNLPASSPFQPHQKPALAQHKQELAMATVTTAAVAIPSFTGLKAAGATTAKVSASQALPKLSIKASLKDVGVAVAAAAASAILASNALARDVLLGGDDGSLAFVPGNFTVSSGEKIVFKNNTGFPHNVVFDQDEVPAGVDATKIAMPEEDLLNGPGETFSVVLTEKGTYGFYCSPHQGAGMVGKVTVK